MKKVAKSPEKVIQGIVEDLISHLKIDATLAVTKKDEDTYRIDLETKDTGLLIGYHGEVINSLQLLIGVFVYRKLGSWLRIIVDVGDYREKREEAIKKMALEKASEASSSRQLVILPYLSPLERRIVHLTLSDNPNVTSYSEGEGKDRRVIIKPREA